MDSVKQKIDEYKSAISKYLEQNHIEDAAMNVRHILELILSEYVKRFAPEYVYAKSIDKISKLRELKIIDEISENSLHQMRKLGNRAAHKDENAPISKEEIEIILPVIDLIANSLINRITNMKNAPNTENDMQRAFSEEWVLSLYNSSNTIYEMNQLISLLEKYPEDQTSEFINRCKEKKQKIYERTHAKEVHLDEIKKKFFYPANKLIVSNGVSTIRARCITGPDVLLPKDTYNSILKPEMSILTWKNVKKIRENYALFNNGKIGITYLDKKSEYLSDYTYGIWDNIVDFDISRDLTNDKDYIFAVTDSGKVKATYSARGLHEYLSWNNICKIYVKDYCGDRDITLIGLEKDGTAHIMSSSLNKYEKEELCLKLSKIKNICDIQFLYNSFIVLTADGKVIELLDSKYSLASFPGIEDWENIIQIKVEYTHIIGLKSDGTVVGIKADSVDVRRDCCATENWTNIVAIFSSTNLSIGLKATGHIVSCGKDSQNFKARICYNVFKFEEECENYNRKKQLLNQIEDIKNSYDHELQRLKNMLSQVDNQINICEQEINLLYEEKNRKILAFSTYRRSDISSSEKKLESLLSEKNVIISSLKFIQDRIAVETKPCQEEIEAIDKMFKDDESELLSDKLLQKATSIDV